MYSKILQYLLFISLFILAQSAAMWGHFMLLPYKHLSMWEAYKMAIPFAWLDWLLMTFAINIDNKYKLVTPTQITLILIIVQFILIILLNKYYLKYKIYTSDYVAFFIILTGLYISFNHCITKYIGIPISDKEDNEENVKTYVT